MTKSIIVKEKHVPDIRVKAVPAVIEVIRKELMIAEKAGVPAAI